MLFVHGGKRLWCSFVVIHFCDAHSPEIDECDEAEGQREAAALVLY
jgi:hypothetical protein